MKKAMKLIMSDIKSKLLIENTRNKKDYAVVFDEFGDLILVEVKK